MASTRRLNPIQRAAQWVAEQLIPDWFGPNNPLTPSAPEAAVDGRQFDYGVGANMQITPKTETGSLRAITFPQLRWLAESTEVLRAVIETRKDKICGMDWDFRVIGKSSRESRNDARIKWLKRFYRKPDGIHYFDEWFRSIQEDLCVIDAPAIHVRRDGKGQILAFEQVDGATIKPLMTELGRQPEAPIAAYQQILKGLPAIYYSTDDLIYRPRNPRIHTLYGFSPVEQIQVYANMAIRRQMQQLGYFTEGNMPEGIVPVAGTAEQIQKFQKIWDAGEINGQKVGRVRFVPAETATKFIPFKDPILADAFDEWMARVTCYVFAEEPTPFIKSINRATAEQANASATSSGINVQIRWCKSFLDEQIQDYLGFEDIEAYVVPAKETDPAKVTARVVALKAANIMSQEEARDEEGLEGPGPEVLAPAPVAPTESSAKPEPFARLSRSEVFDARLSRAEALAQQVIIADFTAMWLKNAAQIGADAILDQMTKVARAEGDAWWATVDFEQDNFLGAITPAIESIWDNSAKIAAGTTGVHKIGFKREASEWARERGAWLVGKSVDPETGNIRDALRPEYRIDNMCRDAIRKTFETATKESWTSTKISESLMNDHAFSRSRALTIAQTEIVYADEAGKIGGWKSTGLDLEKKSLLAANENHGPDDISNAGQGWIPLERSFQSGHEAPPYHTNCRCSTIARSVKK